MIYPDNAKSKMLEAIETNFDREIEKSVQHAARECTICIYSSQLTPAYVEVIEKYRAAGWKVELMGQYIRFDLSSLLRGE